MNETIITAKMQSDGTVSQLLPDGSLRVFSDLTPRPMTEGEGAAEAARDTEGGRPMTEGELQRARRVPRIKTMRRALGITQEEFATRYHVPLGTLRDWEQGRSEPDQPARAYLAVIAHDPEGVRRALVPPDRV